MWLKTNLSITINDTNNLEVYERGSREILYMMI